MASAAFQIPAANIRGDTTNPVTIADVADTNVGKWVAQYPNATSKGHFCVWFPANYLSGNPSCKVRMRSTSGSAAQTKQFPAVYGFKQSGDGLTTSGTSLTHQDMTFNAANQIEEITFSLATGVAASRLLVFRLDSNNTGTLATAEVLDLNFEYVIDPSIRKGYLWIPANAFVIPNASGATLTSRDIESGSGIVPWVIAYRDAVSDYADVRVLLPASFRTNLTCRQIWATGASTGNLQLETDMGSAAVGASADPTLTTGTAYTLTTGSNNTIYFDSDHAAPISPNAGDEVQIRITRLGNDGSDTSTVTCHLIGIVLTWDTVDKNPVCISMSPLSGAQTGGNLSLDTDSNSSKIVQSYPTGTDNHADFAGQLPSLYGSGGTLRVRWRSSNSDTTHAVRWRVDVCSPASGSSSDPSLTTGSNQDILSSGAGLINEFTTSLSSGFVASDNVFVRINRIGTGDSFPGTAEILSCNLEFNLS